MVAVQERLATDIRMMREAAEASREGATHAESRAEDPKDMRGTEVAYLARGQAVRVAEMEDVALRLRHLQLRTFGDEPVSVGALVDVEVDEHPRTYFLVPLGGGIEVVVDDRKIMLVSTQTPVGRALLGKEEGDDFELRVGKNLRDYVITSVS